MLHVFLYVFGVLKPSFWFATSRGVATNVAKSTTFLEFFRLTAHISKTIRSEENNLSTIFEVDCICDNIRAIAAF